MLCLDEHVNDHEISDKEVIDMKIYKTKNYDQFILLERNRPVNPSRLVDSIMEKNLLPEKPILVTNNMEVLDGQHRLAAARELDLYIYYTISRQSVDDDDLGLLNTQLGWGGKDFIKMHARPGNSYDILQRLITKYKLENQAKLIVKMLAVCRKTQKNDFKRGRLELRYCEEECFNIIGKMMDLRSVILSTLNMSFRINTTALYSIFNIVTNDLYDHETAVKRFSLPSARDKLRDAFKWGAVAYMEDALKQIYNFHTEIKLK